MKYCPLPVPQVTCLLCLLESFEQLHDPLHCVLFAILLTWVIIISESLKHNYLNFHRFFADHSHSSKRCPHTKQDSSENPSSCPKKCQCDNWTFITRVCAIWENSGSGSKRWLWRWKGVSSWENTGSCDDWVISHCFICSYCCGTIFDVFSFPSSSEAEKVGMLLHQICVLQSCMSIKSHWLIHECISVW